MTAGVVVPVYPTDEMLAVFQEHAPHFDLRISSDLRAVLRLMLAAAPPYEPSEAEVEAAAIEMGWTQYIGLGWEGFKTAAEYWAGIPAETRAEHLRVARAALIAADRARRG